VLKSVGAVAAGFVTAAVLTFGTDAALSTLFPSVFGAEGDTPAAPVLCFILAYTVAFGVLGSYLAAWFAPSHPMRHALALGAIALAIALLFTIVLWESAPAWYHVASDALILPASYLGGLMRQRKSPPDSPTHLNELENRR
jgi:hypothetical protein